VEKGSRGSALCMVLTLALYPPPSAYLVVSASIKMHTLESSLRWGLKFFEPFSVVDGNGIRVGLETKAELIL
jgi:hypothetical protein